MTPEGWLYILICCWLCWRLVVWVDREEGRYRGFVGGVDLACGPDVTVEAVYVAGEPMPFQVRRIERLE